MSGLDKIAVKSLLNGVFPMCTKQKSNESCFGDKVYPCKY